MSGFTVAIIGRPNVGKSTFFNRLLEQRKAIVDDQSGVWFHEVAREVPVALAPAVVVGAD